MQDNPAFNRLFEGLIQAESGGRHYGDDGNLLTSPVGAQGITQVMPDTAQNPGYGVRPIQDDSEEEYRRFGREYLGALVHAYDGDVRLALAAYNAGSGNVNRAVNEARARGGDFTEYLPMPEETVPYVEKILEHAQANGGLEAEVSGDVDQEQVEAVVDQIPEEGAEVELTEETLNDVVEVAGEEGSGVGGLEVEVEAEEPQELDVDTAYNSVLYDEQGNPQMVQDPDTGEQFLAFPRPKENIEWQELRTDPAWIDASMLVYEMYYNRPPFAEDFESDEEIADWGLNFMNRMNLQIPTLVKLSYDVHNHGTLEQKMALAYLMEQQDQINFSWAGVGRGLKAFATDPTNYLSLTAAVPGLVAKQAATVAAKQTLTQAIKASLLSRTSALLGVEGAAWAGAFDYMTQTVSMEVGLQEDRNYWQTGASMMAGAALASGVGTAIDLIGRRRLVRGFRGKADDADTPDSPAVPPKKTDDEVAPERITPTPQKGRRPEDDVIPEGKPLSQRQLDDMGVPITEVQSALRSTPRNINDAMQYAKVFAKGVRRVPRNQMTLVAEGIRRLNLGPDAMADIQLGVREAAFQLNMRRADLIQKRRDLKVSSRDYKKVQSELDEVEELVVPLNMMDEAFGSMAGSTLRQRRGFGPSRITPESVKREFPNKTQQEAEEIWQAAWRKWEADNAAQKVRDEINPQIDKAAKDGDFDKVVDLYARREGLIDDLYEELPDAAKPVKQILETGRVKEKWINNLFRRLSEVTIANVFGVKTLVINLIPTMVKTLVRPAIHSILKDPFKRAHYVEMAANYGAMASGTRAAMRQGWMALKYESLIISRDHVRFLDADLANTARVRKLGSKNPITAILGAAPGAMRAPLRAMAATDDFLATMAHNGYVAGRVTSEAYAEAMASGMNHAAAKKFAKEAVEKALESKATYREVDERMNIILKKGINMGLRGNDLKTWAYKNAKKDIGHMKKYKDEDVRSYLQDIMFKADFEPDPNSNWYDNSIENIGKGLEKVFNAAPALKYFTGQLFFRTPIRAVEEGFRLTPGLQLLYPRYLSDLMGKNGTRAQTRAIGEHMMSLAIAGFALEIYARGQLNGAGLHNYRQRMLQQDSPEADPYTIEFESGSTWTFRMFDPYATPLKVISTAFEQWDNLAMREAQGENIGRKEWQKVSDYFTSTMLAVALAIKDANLWQGASQTIDLMSALGEESPSDAHGRSPFIKYIGERIRWTLPATVHHVWKAQNPSMSDPATRAQVLIQQTGPLGAATNQISKDILKRGNFITVPRAYDYMGFEKEITDINALFSYLSVATVEEREKGHPEAKLRVMSELKELGERTKGQFTAPYKHRLTGDLDLRMIETGDGDKTLYDVWNENFRSLEPWNEIIQILEAPLPEGTQSNRGYKVEMVQSRVNQYRDIAFQMTMEQHPNLIDELINNLIKDVETGAGFWDAFRSNNSPLR